MSYYTGYGYTPKFEWKDPFPDGIPRKYWDLQYYLESPGSKSQMDDQMFVAGLPGMNWLKNYHVNKESEKKFHNTMDVYGLSFDDIKYPYLTALGGTSNAVGSAVGSATLMVSKNLSRLYN